MSLRKKLKLQPLKETVNVDSEASGNGEKIESKNEILQKDSLLSNSSSNVAKQFLNLEIELSKKVQNINFPKPVTYIYNPVDYAFKTHSLYIEKYCNTTKKVLFLGLNPGPWGMSQTGVPFGEITHVRDWLKIEGEVSKPEKECPNRKVVGFQCKQSEISGLRFWGLMKKVCETPEIFFEHAMVYNYCPIALMDKDGKNVTPAELKGTVQQQLMTFCDETLTDIIRLLEIEVIIAIGRFVEGRAQEALKKASLDCKIKYMLHPSPRIPNNQNWIEKTEKELNNLELMQYFKNTA